MTKNKRIYVALTPEVYNKVIELAKKEKRKKSPMAAMLIEDGLKRVWLRGREISGDEIKQILSKTK